MRSLRSAAISTIVSRMYARVSALNTVVTRFLIPRGMLTTILPPAVSAPTNAPPSEELTKALAKENLILLYTSPWPAQDLYTNKDVKGLTDLKGMKMRSYSPTTSRLADLMGTTPVNIPFSDVAQAFTTNAIDAMITSPSTGVNGQSWDYISHFTTIHAWIPKNMVFANKRLFDRLDENTQQVILTAAANAEKKGWALGRKLAVEHTDTLAKNGMKVGEPSAQLINELEAIGSTMVNEWVSEAGDSGRAVLNAYQQL